MGPPVLRTVKSRAFYPLISDGDVVLDPVAQVFQRFGGAVPEVCEFVFHAGGYLGVDGTGEQPVVFESFQGL